MPSIDMHAHMLVPEVEMLVANEPQRAEEQALVAMNSGPESTAHNKTMLAELVPKLTDLSVRIAEMDAMNIDVQAVSLSPTQYYYWAEPKLAGKIVEAANRHIAAACAEKPDRLVGLAAVSLQHPKLAADQLRKATREQGMRGVEISTRIAGFELADPRFDVFWKAAEELESLVFIHPLGCTLGERIAPFYLSNTIGQPAETTTALSLMIFSGLMDRFPNLRICAAHGGGYLPFYIDRSDHAYSVRPEAQKMDHRPSEYLRRLWFDSLVYTPEGLGRLVSQVGADRIVLGTDYPFDMGMYKPNEQLDAVPGLTQQEREAIRGGTAEFLLHMK